MKNPYLSIFKARNKINGAVACVFIASIVGCTNQSSLNNSTPNVQSEEAIQPLIKKEDRGITVRTKILPNAEHAAIGRFLDFAEYVKQEQPFDDVVSEFFTANDAKEVHKSEGWYRYPYTAALIGLSYGECLKLEWKVVNSHRVKVDCKGPYLLRSFILGESKEYMHFQVTLKKQENEWYLGRGGLAYTQTFGNADVNTDIAELGLKFNYQLTPKDADNN